MYGGVDSFIHVIYFRISFLVYIFMKKNYRDSDKEHPTYNKTKED